jgi:hypothetical protein
LILPEPTAPSGEAACAKEIKVVNAAIPAVKKRVQRMVWSPFGQERHRNPLMFLICECKNATTRYFSVGY